jgi:hypothetical protein
MNAGPREPDALPARGFLDFRKSIGWQGANAPVELELTDTSLRLSLHRRELEEKKQRSAAERLVGEEAFSRIRPSETATAEIPLREARFRFPRVLGRGGFAFKLPDGRQFAVVFTDWRGVNKSVGRSDAVVLTQTAKALRKGPEARRARQAWQAAIERRLAGVGAPARD